MIVPMKKVTLLCMEEHRDEALERLRDVGLLHLVAVRPPESEDRGKLKAEIARFRRALDALPPRPPDRVPPAVAPGPEQAGAIVEETLSLMRQAGDLTEKAGTLRKEVEELAPWGDFDVHAIRSLAADGVVVRLYHAAPHEHIQHSPHARVFVIRTGHAGRFLALIGLEAMQCSATEVPLPERSPGETRREWQSVLRSREQVTRRLAELSRAREGVLAQVESLEAALGLAEVRAGMGVSQAVAYLSGFCPAESVDRLKQAAARFGWGLLLTDPAPDDDTVPTLIRNPRWVLPIKAVLDLIGILPGYREIDINACLLLFLSLFFAILVGDAGYGLIFLALTFWARRRFPGAPAYPFTLLRIMSVATIAWGLLTGTVFAVARLPAPLGLLKVDWLADGQNLMQLCFLIGAGHLTVAHVWNAARTWNRLQALAQLGWIGMTWTMYCLACTLVLGHAFPPVARLVGGVSVVVIAVFMTPLAALKAQWFNHVMLPLNLVGSFIDVVSYIRLYAVGVASLAVGSAFNELAAAQVHSVATGLVAALILFFGHALNITLAAMGVLVHGVRLNVLEFSSHIGMQWAGVPYAPFGGGRSGMTAEKT
jgi:V/A-type H+-transporting ATPase subunit I